MDEVYMKTTVKIERLYRLFLDIVAKALNQIGVHDINNVQALILYHIGDNQVSVGELTMRGYYMGSNVSYNLKKLSQYGYVTQKKAVHDGRSSHVTLSEKGKKLFRQLEQIFKNQSDQWSQALPSGQSSKVYDSLDQMEKFLYKLGVAI